MTGLAGRGAGGTARYQVTVEVYEPHCATDGVTVLGPEKLLRVDRFQVTGGGATEASWAAHDHYRGQQVWVDVVQLARLDTGAGRPVFGQVVELLPWQRELADLGGAKELHTAFLGVPDGPRSFTKSAYLKAWVADPKEREGCGWSVRIGDDVTGENLDIEDLDTAMRTAEVVAYRLLGLPFPTDKAFLIDLNRLCTKHGIRLESWCSDGNSHSAIVLVTRNGKRVPFRQLETGYFEFDQPELWPE